MASLSKTQLKAAEWLEANWESAVRGAPIITQLRDRFGLEFKQSVAVIAEVRRRQGK
jgi:hypothetical protein